jgi:hypothetical protein
MGGGSKKRRTTKKQTAAVDQPVPEPKRRPDIMWTDRDTEILKTALEAYGNDYLKIKNIYYLHREDIDTKAINIHCSNHPELKKIQESNKIKQKNLAIAQFQQSVNKERSLVLSNNHPTGGATPKSRATQGPTVEDDDPEVPLKNSTCDCQTPLSTPQVLSNGMVLVPSISFLRSAPFFTEHKEYYQYVMRYLMDVHVAGITD